MVALDAEEVDVEDTRLAPSRERRTVVISNDVEEIDLEEGVGCGMGRTRSQSLIVEGEALVEQEGRSKPSLLKSCSRLKLSKSWSSLGLGRLSGVVADLMLPSVTSRTTSSRFISPAWTAHSPEALRAAAHRHCSQLATATGDADASPAVLLGARSLDLRGCGEPTLMEGVEADSYAGARAAWPPAREIVGKLFRAGARPAALQAAVVVVWGAIVLAPLAFGKACDSYDLENEQRRDVVQCFLAVPLSLAYYTIHCRPSKTSIWFQLYVITYLIHACILNSWHWYMATCPIPSSTLSSLSVLLEWGLHCTYFWCQLCLAWMSVVCLQRIGKEREAAQAKLLCRLCLACLGFIGYVAALVPKVVKGRPAVIVGYVFQFAALFTYVAFQLRVFSAFIYAGRSALAEARRTGQSSWPQRPRAAATTTLLLIAVAVVFASGSTVAMVLVTISSPELTSVLDHALVVINFSTDVALVVLLSVAMTPAAAQGRSFEIADELSEAARRRHVLGALKEAALAVAGPSVSVAALFGGADPEQILQRAVERFRCVSWETLRRHPYLVISEGPLDGKCTAQDLYSLSEPCKLSGCDAFFSHSWHDDPWEKWERLTEWCTEFQSVHGRAPLLWFDKVCIDQANIESDLRCLPIFLAGCKTLLVLCGKTYTTRLWCCVELFVFMKMSEGLDQEIHVCCTGTGADDVEQVTSTWTNFDVRGCHCVKAEDKDHILECIEKDRGAATGFNAFIRGLAASDLFQMPSSQREREESVGSNVYVVPV
eukprot:TRINITY_DN14111_c0_g1_i2.p1 TRINITY_DN14111_c0_g1~~TRINITY_DN14111_c0_g1_i2.p1  ORF type:complete len:768 (-),score=67.45 TRINITY_DN14111_c0_g1_i2:292-2595(-)